MRVSAVIPNWNGLHYLRTLFESIAGQVFTEVILVDNGSHDGSAEWAETNGARVIRFGSNRGFAAAVNAAMDALPTELRQAVTLREIEGLSYEEIAEVMNCPIGTVRSRIFRAREAISARVKPLLDNQSGKRW